MSLARNYLIPIVIALSFAAASPLAGQVTPRTLFGPSAAVAPAAPAESVELTGGTESPSPARDERGDFTTPAGELWFISEVTAEVLAGRDSALTEPIDVTVAFDDGGKPGAAACERPGIVPTVTPGGSDPDTATLTLDLSTACQVCAGSRYWLVLSTPLRRLSFSLYGYSTRPRYTKGDFNGDLCFDAVLQRRPSPGVHADARVWPLAGLARTGEELVVQPAPPDNLWIAGADDFDGDGRNDLLLRDRTTGELEFWYLDGTTRMGSAPLTGVPEPAALTHLQVEATGDFSHDGRPDLVVRDLDTLRVSVWVLDGSKVATTLAPTPDTTGHPNWRVAGAADLNRDGYRDLVWHNGDSNYGVLWALDGTARRLADPAASGYFLGCRRPQDPPYLWGIRAVGVNGPAEPGIPGPVAPGTAYLLWQLDPNPELPPNTEFCDPQPGAANGTPIQSFNSHERLIIWQGGGRPGGGGPGGLTFTAASHLHLPGDEDEPQRHPLPPENDWWIVGPR